MQLENSFKKTVRLGGIGPRTNFPWAVRLSWLENARILLVLGSP